MGIPKEYSRAKQNVENSVHGNFFSVSFLHVCYCLSLLQEE